MLNAQEVRTVVFILSLLLLGTFVRACREQPSLEDINASKTPPEEEFERNRSLLMPD